MYKRQWGLENRGYSRGQNRSASRNRYSAQQVKYNSDYELAEALREENVSEKDWDQMCEMIKAEVELVS